MFGSYGIWSKILGPTFGIFFQGWVRSAIVLVILLPIAYFTNNLRKIDKEDYAWLLTTVIFGAFTQVPLYYAYVHSGIGISSVIFFAVFLLTSYVISWFFLHERVTTVKIVAFFLALIGLALPFSFSLKEFSLIALLAAGLNGIASGGEVTTSKKTTSKYSSMQVTILVWLGTLVTHLPLSLLTHEKQLPISFNGPWLAMFAYAITGIIGFTIVVEGFKYIEGSVGSLIGLMEIVFGILFGILFFHEHLTLSILFGASIILVAAALPALDEFYKSKKATQVKT